MYQICSDTAEHCAQMRSLCCMNDNDPVSKIVLISLTIKLHTDYSTHTYHYSTPHVSLLMHTNGQIIPSSQS